MTTRERFLVYSIIINKSGVNSKEAKEYFEEQSKIDPDFEKEAKIQTDIEMGLIRRTRAHGGSNG